MFIEGETSDRKFLTNTAFEKNIHNSMFNKPG